MLRSHVLGDCIFLIQIYIYIYLLAPPQDQYFDSLADVHVSEHCFPCWRGGVTGIQKIFWLLGRCSCVSALFSMLMWKSYRNSEDKLSLQVACTMLSNRLFVFHWANVSKLFCICTNLSLPNLLFISKKFGLQRHLFLYVSTELS